MNRSKERALAALLSVFVVSACGSPESKELSPEAEAEIVTEITSLLHQYTEATMAWDSVAMNRFWGDSDQFVMAGDGSIMGGHAEWSANRSDTESRLGRFLSFDYSSIHVAVLSPEAVSATAEFEYSLVWASGDTLRHRGAWTYVFRRDEAGWDVIHSNGTHVEF